MTGWLIGQEITGAAEPSHAPRLGKNYELTVEFPFGYKQLILNHMKRLLSQVCFFFNYFDSIHKVHTPKHERYSVLSKTSQSRQNKRSFFLSGLQLLSLRVIESWRYISNATFPLVVLYTVFLCSF